MAPKWIKDEERKDKMTIISYGCIVGHVDLGDTAYIVLALVCLIAPSFLIDKRNSFGLSFVASFEPWGLKSKLIEYKMNRNTLQSPL